MLHVSFQELILNFEIAVRWLIDVQCTLQTPTGNNPYEWHAKWVRLKQTNNPVTISRYHTLAWRKGTEIALWAVHIWFLHSRVLEWIANSSDILRAEITNLSPILQQLLALSSRSGSTWCWWKWDWYLSPFFCPFLSIFSRHRLPWWNSSRPSPHLTCHQSLTLNRDMGCRNLRI